MRFKASPPARTCLNKPVNWMKVLVMKMMVTKAAAATAAVAAAAGDVAYISIMIKMINFRSKYIVTSA